MVIFEYNGLQVISHYATNVSNLNTLEIIRKKLDLFFLLPTL